MILICLLLVYGVAPALFFLNIETLIGFGECFCGTGNSILKIGFWILVVELLLIGLAEYLSILLVVQSGREYKTPATFIGQLVLCDSSVCLLEN